MQAAWPSAGWRCATSPGKAGFCAFAPAAILAAIACLVSGVTAAGDLPAQGEALIERSLAQLVGQADAAAYAGIFEPEEILSWVVYRPEAGSGDRPPGVLVYVSPENSGRLLPRWTPVLDQHRLVYVAARDSGNGIPDKRRVVLAVLAIRMLEQEFALDPRRIYVAGFSGGGRVASLLATRYSSLFAGALYICGVDFWKREHPPDPERLRRNRYVFLTGSKDFNRRETKAVYRRYLKAGARNSKYIEVRGMSHEVPYAADLDEALGFLDGNDDAG